MDDVSPPKWHLAHTTWFFETFLLKSYLSGYQDYHPQYNYLFNSYYEAVGDRHPRPQRGLLSRPTVKEVYAYRAAVDEAMTTLIAHQGDNPQLQALLTLGLHHEQQHQELLVTDIKYNLGQNPLYPIYCPKQSAPEGFKASISSKIQEEIDSTFSIPKFPTASDWLPIQGGIETIGWDQPGFAFDNELPRHQVLLRDSHLCTTLVTNREYLEFMLANGYHQPQYWLSEGWSWVQRTQTQAPLYWYTLDGEWWEFSLQGCQPIDGDAPVCHISFFEADAYARWRGLRLPTEAEWEVVAQRYPVTGQFLHPDELHPQTRSINSTNYQLYGTVWEWTQSPYTPYPGYVPASGAIGEYNGKFMCNQMVLRGGSCASPSGHLRPSYRNFFPPDARWQFSGIRLCRDSLR
jgi:ergothioneine biosynthesis protein EgtB